MQQQKDMNITVSDKILKVHFLEIPEINCSVDIYNKAGKFIKHVELHKKISSINIKSLTPDIYVFIFLIGKKIKPFRIIKK